MRADFEKAENVEERPKPVRLRDLPGKRRGSQHQDMGQGLDFPFWRVLLRNLMLATLLALAPSCLAIGITVALWLGSGVPPMNRARLETVSAEDAFHRTLKGTQPLLAELGALGAPQDQLEVVYFAFDDSTGEEHRKLADTYLGVLVDHVNQVAGSRGLESMGARRQLLPAIEARNQAHEAWLRWQELLATSKGKAITTLWMVDPPSPGMELYQLGMARKLLPPPDPTGHP